MEESIGRDNLQKLYLQLCEIIKRKIESAAQIVSYPQSIDSIAPTSYAETAVSSPTNTALQRTALLCFRF